MSFNMVEIFESLFDKNNHVLYKASQKLQKASEDANVSDIYKMIGQVKSCQYRAEGTGRAHDD